MFWYKLVNMISNAHGWVQLGLYDISGYQLEEKNINVFGYKLVMLLTYGTLIEKFNSNEVISVTIYYYSRPESYL